MGPTFACIAGFLPLADNLAYPATTPVALAFKLQGMIKVNNVATDYSGYP
jgi:hypothetical protein